MDWQYQVRKSKRAKRLQLQITTERGLEVVVPHRMKTFDVHALFKEHFDWIKKTLGKIVIQAPSVIELPRSLNLLAKDEVWKIIYQPQAKSRIHVRTYYLTRNLILTGPVTDFALVQRALKKWLMKYAQNHFLPELAQLSEEVGLKYQQAFIRSQKSRWGSCNAQGIIHLNCQMLFLPKEWGRHIMLHELCHTQHMNHSPRFWALLAELDENCITHRHAVKFASDHIPKWLMY